MQISDKIRKNKRRVKVDKYRGRDIPLSIGVLRNQKGVAMKVASIVILFFIFISAAGVLAGTKEGASVFESLKCSMCHKPDKKAAAVSLNEIAKTYQDSGQMLKLFSGESKPLIESDKWGMMRGQMPKIQALKDSEKKDLADYILSFK
jgi:cytochrome c551/c552